MKNDIRQASRAVAHALGHTVKFAWLLVVFIFVVALSSLLGGLLLHVITGCDYVSGVLFAFAVAVPSFSGKNLSANLSARSLGPRSWES